MKSYKTVAGAAQSEYVVSRSKFLAYCYPIQSAEEAEERLSALKALHPFATHICYAYIAGRAGNLQKASDAGEPKGTAGPPILEVLKHNGLTCALVAVVRYFGGVKLGTGGLTRAYARAASDALKNTETKEYRLMSVLEIVLDFAAAARIRTLKHGIEVKREFGEAVVLTLASPEPEKLKEETDGILQRKAEYTEKGAEYL
ncbi:hypothetical protein FACS1894211_13540 [Clostridia bacterium]|nr:hypothetical protein FACS1894211_13540 [Clostridia bacterium]